MSVAKLGLWRRCLAAVVIGLTAAPCWANDPTAYCFQALNASAAYAELYQKLSVGKDASPEQLTDSSFANEGEKRLLTSLGREVLGCVAAGRQYRAAMGAPAFVDEMLGAYVNRVNGILGFLYDGKITFGEANRQRREALIQQNVEWADKVAAYRQHESNAAAAQAQRAQQVQDAQLQAMEGQRRAMELSNTLNIIRLLQPPPNPTIHCNTTGGRGMWSTTCR